MFRQSPALLILSVAVIAFGCSYSPPSIRTIEGKVTKVHDGDSIHITPTGEKRVVIRLAGIDAPELAQPFGLESRNKLRSLILRENAKAICNKTDRYQRQVCVVLNNGVDINLQMVAGGLAWHYKQYEKEQSRKQRKDYSQAERNARRSQLGLWSEKSVEPWVFRKANN